MIVNLYRVRFIVTVLLLLKSASLISAEKSKSDSLEAVLKTLKPDTTRVNTLCELSREKFMQSDYPNTRVYGTQALELAVKLNYPKGIYMASINLGNADLYEAKYELAGKRFSEALNAAEETKVKSFIASSKKNLGNVYYYKGMLTEALELNLASLAIFKELKRIKDIAGAYNNIAAIYTTQGNSATGLKYYYDALKIYDSLADQRGMSSCYLNIGSIYNSRKEHGKSIEYCEKSLSIDKELGDKFGVSLGYNNIGIDYNELGEYEKGLEYSNRALEISKELGDEKGIGTAKYNIAVIRKKQQKYKEAEEIFLEVNGIGINTVDHELQTMSCSALAELYLLTGRFNMARSFAVKGLSVAKEVEEGPVRSFYELISRIDSAQGDYKSAYENYKSYSLRKDSAMNLDNEKRFTQMEMTYEFSKKEDSLKLVQISTDSKLREQFLITSKQKTANSYLIAAMVLLIILSVLVYKNYQTRQQLKIQSLRNKIASDLHDDVGSTLSSISIFSQIAQEQSKDVVPMVEKIGEYSRNMLDAMGDIVWTINPENDQFEKFVMRMRNFAYELLGAKQIDFDFTADDVSSVNLSMEARKNLYLIFKEATNNMAKYSGANEARFAIRKEKELLTMMIRDNGKGFDSSVETEGNGLRNMKKRAIQIDARLLIDSIPGTGTTIKIEMAV